ncbi:MAG: 5'-deoxynucleotidase [Lachnospiraceae bacterium]|nr:5'-deoxynucleotidase [Lachnospiraceae bacterium]
MGSHFFAMMSRMRYIERWALMRNAYSENISEHSLEVSMIAHALTIISNKRCGNQLDASKAALIALYHDATEIITGDMPTPIKYYNRDIEGAFKQIEENAANKLLHMLPEDLRDEYTDLFFPAGGDEYLWKLVKAADRISALIKCIEEKKAGNYEFESAKATIESSIAEMNLPEVTIFMTEFLPSYFKTLDELQ